MRGKMQPDFIFSTLHSRSKVTNFNVFLTMKLVRGLTCVRSRNKSLHSSRHPLSSNSKLHALLRSDASILSWLHIAFFAVFRDFLIIFLHYNLRCFSLNDFLRLFTQIHCTNSRSQWQWRQRRRRHNHLSSPHFKLTSFILAGTSLRLPRLQFKCSFDKEHDFY